MNITSQARVAGNQMFHTGETSITMGTGSQKQMLVNHQETGVGYIPNGLTSEIPSFGEFIGLQGLTSLSQEADFSSTERSVVLSFSHMWNY